MITLGPNIFEEATVDTAIFLVGKTKKVDNKISIIQSPLHNNINENSKYYVSQDRFSQNQDLVFDHLLNDKQYEIVKKLVDHFPKIDTGFEFGVGINTGYIKSELVSNTKIDDRFHPMVPGTGISRYGIVKSVQYIMYDKQFVLSKGRLGRSLPDERFFTNPKILIVRTRNLSLKQRIVATIDTEKKYNLNRLSNIIARNGYNIYGLLGILNSKLFNWLFSTRYFDYEIKPIYLRNLPLADTNNSDLILKVKNLLLLNNPEHNQDHSQEITLLENEIDNLIYKLYGLTEDEIKLIESSQ